MTSLDQVALPPALGGPLSFSPSLRSAPSPVYHFNK